MTVRVSIEVVAETREDAVRLVRDAAIDVKRGQHGVERQHCMGALRVSVVDDSDEDSVSACKRCGGSGFIDAPSHSVERSQFGVGPVGVYFCPDCRRGAPA